MGRADRTHLVSKHWICGGREVVNVVLENWKSFTIRLREKAKVSEHPVS
jgi:hypothetical protein